MNPFPPHIPFDPTAAPAAQVHGPNVRFTVLTGRMLRLEYSPSSEFEDHPSQAFWFRRLPVPEFETRQTPGQIEIETQFLHLVYRISAHGFTPDHLSIRVKTGGQAWYYGDPPQRGGNLKGTARTLDETKGTVSMESGLVGRLGWATYDDLPNLVFNDQDWLEARRHPENIDLYFFGYGQDYVGCLAEFSQVAGQVPLIPRWVLGNWWSRYWEYSQDELLGLMAEFKQRQVPLSVCIVDMDWHITKTGNHSSGWTGYTWNKVLFPDPTGFLAGLHHMGLKTALNLHPAEGIHPHEARYAEFASRIGSDPDEGLPQAFDCADLNFMRAYFEVLHHPYEAQGVDFWWIDWQQGQRSILPGLDPLWWLNHLHFYDLARDGVKRPFIFSRWGGLGNHRYPIGFSGDTVISWESLNHLPGFTANAANVGYGWWSHDIGGHMGGIEDDELYVRWVQYGLFSPILRLHSTKNPFHERLPWGRGPAAGQFASKALRMRHTLIPYIYSMAWRHHTTSIPLITPMYYSHPESPEAYQVPQQYWFGSELLAVPFTTPADSETRLSRQVVWLPEDGWFDFFSGEYLAAGWQSYYGTLEDIPVFARPGAIVPFGAETGWGGTALPECLHIYIFPGADGRFELVEDDGETTGYLIGAYAVTVFQQTWKPDQLVFAILPAKGETSLIPKQREIHLHLRGVLPPRQVQAKLDHEPMQLNYTHDPSTATLDFEPFSIDPDAGFQLILMARSSGLASKEDRSQNKLYKYLSAFKLDSWIKQKIFNEWTQIESGEKSLHAYPELTDAQFLLLESLLRTSIIKTVRK